ncbi:hypothetical protein EJ576_04555 [Pseudomonas sp. C 49-2]|nr:hypothetical protein EJ576_04555 [Pseudomonas sp. C 49-2]
MDNFMEQPTYKMNRGAILAQGYRRIAGGFCNAGTGKPAPTREAQVMSAETGASSPMACRRA